MCTDRVRDWANDFWHVEHLNGFSPEWILQWRVKLLEHANVLLQTSQLKGISSEWVLICLVRWRERANDFWHAIHLNGFSLQWVLKWTLNWWYWANTSLQNLHLYAFQLAQISGCFTTRLDECDGIMFVIGRSTTELDDAWLLVNAPFTHGCTSISVCPGWFTSSSFASSSFASYFTMFGLISSKEPSASVILYYDDPVTQTVRSSLLWSTMLP